MLLQHLNYYFYYFFNRILEETFVQHTLEITSFIRFNMLRQHLNYLFYYSFKRILAEYLFSIHFINHIFHTMKHVAATFLF